MPEDPVKVELSGDEALVLFAWLTRIGARTDSFAELAVDPAEQRVLWDLTCVLESALSAPFSTEHAELVERARARVRDEA